MDTDTPKTPVVTGIIEIDFQELVVRMYEAVTKSTRPIADPAAAANTLPNEVHQQLEICATVAIRYVIECVKTGMSTSSVKFIDANPPPDQKPN